MMLPLQPQQTPPTFVVHGKHIKLQLSPGVLKGGNVQSIMSTINKISTSIPKMAKVTRFVLSPVNFLKASNLPIAISSAIYYQVNFQNQNDTRRLMKGFVTFVLDHR